MEDVSNFLSKFLCFTNNLLFMRSWKISTFESFYFFKSPSSSLHHSIKKGFLFINKALSYFEVELLFPNVFRNKCRKSIFWLTTLTFWNWAYCWMKPSTLQPARRFCESDFHSKNWWSYFFVFKAEVICLFPTNDSLLTEIECRLSNFDDQMIIQSLVKLIWRKKKQKFADLEVFILVLLHFK